ncbi:MAG: rRNA maturation RNase YbeY [Micropepsaceae bacterium]
MPAKLKPAIAITAPQWRKAVPGLPARARLVAAAAHEAALADGASPLTGETTIAFADDATIRPLNARFRGKDKPTNVLSFPGLDGGGDVILAYETMVKEAETQGKTLTDHTTHLIAHGILHLMGYDHEQGRAEARRMERLERLVLSGLGVADPYD